MSKTTTKGFDVPKGFPIPFNKSVIVERLKDSEVTSGGLILSASTQKNNTGRIMAFSPNCNNAESLYPGQKVMFNVMSLDREIEFEGNLYFIMSELDLFCDLSAGVLVPEGVDKRAKEKDEKIAKEQKRLNDNYKKEMNKADEIMEKKKRVFNKKK